MQKRNSTEHSTTLAMATSPNGYGDLCLLRACMAQTCFQHLFRIDEWSLFVPSRGRTWRRNRNRVHVECMWPLMGQRWKQLIWCVQFWDSRVKPCGVQPIFLSCRTHNPSVTHHLYCSKIKHSCANGNGGSVHSLCSSIAFTHFDHAAFLSPPP